MNTEVRISPMKSVKPEIKSIRYLLKDLAGGVVDVSVRTEFDRVAWSLTVVFVAEATIKQMLRGAPHEKH